jgi:hypothetical protein
LKPEPEQHEIVATLWQENGMILVQISKLMMPRASSHQSHFSFCQPNPTISAYIHSK